MYSSSFDADSSWSASLMARVPVPGLPGRRIGAFVEVLISERANNSGKRSGCQAAAFGRAAWQPERLQKKIEEAMRGEKKKKADKVESPEQSRARWNLSSGTVPLALIRIATRAPRVALRRYGMSMRLPGSYRGFFINSLARSVSVSAPALSPIRSRALPRQAYALL